MAKVYDYASQRWCTPIGVGTPTRMEILIEAELVHTVGQMQLSAKGLPEQMVLLAARALARISCYNMYKCTTSWRGCRSATPTGNTISYESF